MATPKCKQHGPMVLRPERRYTVEQRWCGQWWDCERCTGSVLIPSDELKASLRQFEAAMDGEG